jgi:hypothetical protein
MSKNWDNRLRAFAEVVSIDAWHEGFESGKGTADLHADVVFGTGRLGGEPESQVRFRLRVKRADLVLIVPETEPVDIPRRSINRFSSAMSMKRSITQTSEKKGSVAGGGKIEVSQSGGASASASLSAGAAFEGKLEERLEYSQQVLAIRVIHRFSNADGCDHWAFEPTFGPTLEGRAWVPEETPLATARDTRSHLGRGIPPVVRFEVRCLLEDLEIANIQLKRGGVFPAIGAAKNRMKAAEAYIRNQLLEAGLEVRGVSDPFDQIVLGSVVANAESPGNL